MLYSPALAEGIRDNFTRPSQLELIKGANESDDEARVRIAATYAHALAWREDDSAKRVLGVKENEVVRPLSPPLLERSTSSAQITTHPVLNITPARATLMLNFYYEQPQVIAASNTL